jgi:hypothetical protein
MRVIDRIGLWMQKHPFQYMAALAAAFIATGYAFIYFWSRA